MAGREMIDRMEMIKTEGIRSVEERDRAVEFALFEGFRHMAAEFPIASPEGTLGVPASLDGIELEPLPTRAPEDFTPSSITAKKIPAYEWRKQTGLERMFELGAFLKDDDCDLLPDRLDVKLIFPDRWDAYLLAAACNVAFRFGMETTSFTGPFVAPKGYEGNAVVFEGAGHPSMRMEQDGGACRVIIGGTGADLLAFTNDICERFPLLPESRTWSDVCRDIADSMTMGNLDGQLAYLEAFRGQLGDRVTALVDPEASCRAEELERAFPGVEFCNFKGRKKVYHREYDIPWEVDDFRGKLQSALDRVAPGDEVEVFAALSEERAVRSRLASDIEERLAEKGAHSSGIHIICAYKQGYSWIDEILLPKLEGKGAAKIQIQFKPFLPKGQTAWLDENGATPSRGFDQGDPDKWFDLPIRYLQELYPIADDIQDKIGVPISHTEFVPYEGSEDITYLFRAFDADGRIVLEDSYRAACSERPYLDMFPGRGKVHPSTGFVSVKVGGEQVLNERVETDVERIWDVYQKDVLPELAAFVEKKTGGDVSEGRQPFFSRVNLEVTASEPDFPLKSREDMISSLEGLHEDMYFVGADFFKTFGMERIGKVLDAPGLILPIIKKGKGKPSFSVTLEDVVADRPELRDADRVIVSMSGRDGVGACIRGISRQDGKTAVTIGVEAPDVRIVRAYADLFGKGLLSLSGKLSGVDVLRFESSGEAVEAPVESYRAPEENRDIRSIDLMEDRLIGYEDCQRILDQLEHVEGISVFRTAVSYEGRDVRAIELLPRWKGYVSRVKRLSRLPSEIINSRHHANEVSSTNSAFILLKRLLTDRKYLDLPEKMNLVIVPMENADGSALHYELQKDSPCWKLHVARFNAVGKEFFQEHFKRQTIHTEALGLTKLFYRYLPDIVVDNHGVPSHEWDQQFSGYTSPSFKGFWLPRSLLYGYFWYVTDPEYKSNLAVDRELEDRIADAIGADPEMKGLNEEWIEQFEKYAHAFMPKLFPADYYKEMIDYWIPYTQSLGNSYPATKFPWITTTSYTSEVADETAQGAYLNLCARAHVTQDLAIIDAWADSRSVFEESLTCSNGALAACQRRLRPILADSSAVKDKEE